MAEVNLTSRRPQAATPLVVNLKNADTGEVVKYGYTVGRLSGKTAMETQLAMAEFAREKDRNAIVGSLMMQQILKLVKPDEGSPDMLDLIDQADDEALAPLVEVLVQAATASSVGA